MGYAILVTEFGFNLTAARDISVAREKPEVVARIYWSTQAAKSLLFLACSIVLAAVVFAIPSFRQHWSVFAASGLLVLGCVVFPQWYFQGLERLRDVASFQAAAKCTIAATALLFVHSPRDGVIAALILSAPQLVATLAAIALGKAMRPAIFYRPSWSDIVEAMHRGWHLFLSSLSSSLYGYTNTFVLGLLAGPGAAALYNVAERLVLAIQALAGPVTQSVFPRVSLLFAEDAGRAWGILRRTTKFLLPAIALASLATALLAPWLVRLIGGGGYAGAVPVLRVMAVVPLLVTSSTLLAQLVIVNLNLTAQLPRIYFGVGILNIMLLVPLILKLGAVGAGVALVIAQTMLPTLMLLVLLRNRRTAALRSGSPG